MGTITATNAVITLTQPIIFPTPVQLKGFGPDDVYGIDSIKSVETVMGVDGVLSGGFVYTEVKQNITIQADSPSGSFFDVLWAQMQAAQDTYPLNGIILLPSISTKYIMTQGFLTGYVPAPGAKKTLQPRVFEITWARISAAPST